MRVLGETGSQSVPVSRVGYELQQLIRDFRASRIDGMFFLALLPKGILCRVGATLNLSRNDVAVIAISHHLY